MVRKGNEMEKIRNYIQNINLKSRLHDEYESIKDEEQFRNCMMEGFERFLSIKDLHKGEEAIVMGLGPSLLEIDKDRYEHCTKITCNHFQKVPNFFEGSFKPDYWCGAQGIEYLEETFLNCIDQGTRSFITIAKKTEFEQLIEKHKDKEAFKKYSYPWIWENQVFQRMLAEKYGKKNIYSRCNTITNHMIALSLWLGFSKIYITGFDLSYNVAMKKGGHTHAGFTIEKDNGESGIASSSMDAFDDIAERAQILKDLKYFCKIAYENNIEIHNLSHHNNKLPYNMSFKKT